MKKASDRNLLFGVLALQLDFIQRDDLVRGMNAWLLEKHLGLGQVLVQQGTLAADTQALLETLVDKHLKMHGDDPSQSLAAVGAGALHEELSAITDPGVQAALSQRPLSGGGATSRTPRYLTSPGKRRLRRRATASYGRWHAAASARCRWPLTSNCNARWCSRRS